MSGSASDLRAQFTLSLEDKLSAGLDKLLAKFDRLKALTAKIGLDKLAEAGAGIDRTAGRVGQLDSKLHGVASAANQAAEAIKRTSSAAAAGIKLPRIDAAAFGRSLNTAIAGRAAEQAAEAGLGERLRALGPLNGPGGEGLNATIERAGGAVRGLRDHLRASVGHVRELGEGMRHVAESAMGAAAGAFGLVEPIREYAKYEWTTRHIAITAGTPDGQVDAVSAGLMAKYNKLALATSQRSEDVAESANFLITTGIGNDAVDKMLPLVARASTAYNTRIGDSVQAVFSLKENLGVSDADLSGVVSAMAQAGKEGHFSFANFSQFLPNIAPGAAGMGFKDARARSR